MAWSGARRDVAVAAFDAAAAACAGSRPNVAALVGGDGRVAVAAVGHLGGDGGGGLPPRGPLAVLVDVSHHEPASTRAIGAADGVAALLSAVERSRRAARSDDAFDCELLALTALANVVEVDVANCERLAAAPSPAAAAASSSSACAYLARRLADAAAPFGAELQGGRDDAWAVEDVLLAAHLALPLACVARVPNGRAAALAAVAAADIGPRELAKILEAFAALHANAGALTTDVAGALATLVADLGALAPRADDDDELETEPPTPPKKKRPARRDSFGVPVPSTP